MARLLLVLVIVACSLCCGCIGNVNNPTSSDHVPMAIQEFIVTPRIIDAGMTANLSWNITGARSVSIDNGVGQVSLSGVSIVRPSATTTYVLTAENDTISITAQTQVIVRSGDGGDQIDGGQVTPTVSMTSSPVAGAGVCSITIVYASSPAISWASTVKATLNCITNATTMGASHVRLPGTGSIAGGDLVSINGLAAGSQYSLTLTYKPTAGTMGTVTWNQI